MPSVAASALALSKNAKKRRVRQRSAIGMRASGHDRRLD
jgi:hypothetical protein